MANHRLSFGLCSGAVIVVFLVGACATAGSPKLAKLSPPGGQRGTTVEVDFIGRFVGQPREVLFYESGITVESIKPVETAIGPNGREQPVEAGTRFRVRMKIASDCQLGPHGLRLRTDDGLTEYQRFFVGPFPTVEENETNQKRNDKRDAAMSVTGNVTVHGRLHEPADVDVYMIEVKRLQRVTAEVEAARLGVERGIPDLHLAILDPDGRKLAAADDSALFVQDPVLSVLAEKDGLHFIEVRHSTYNGTADTYRLHVGTFTRPTGLYPAGGQAGTDLTFRVLGDPLGERQQVVRLPSTLGDFPTVVKYPVDGVSAPSANRLRVSPFGNVLEAEPNDTPEALKPDAVADLPIAFNGIIDKAGDVDCFRFRAKKGEQFTIHALAQTLGSPLDPVIWVKPIGGKGAPQRATDSRPNQLGIAPGGGLPRETLDPLLEFTAPADGEYVLGVEDERGEGGRDYVYRVEVRADENAVYAYVAPEPENQNLPQLRQSVIVAPGNRFTMQIAIFNTNRPPSGDLELTAVNLPKGVTMHAPKFTAGVTKVPVVFEASADVEPQAALIDLVVRPVDGKGTLASGYRQVILMNSYGNNEYYLHTPVSKLALAVTEPAVIRVEVEEPKSALVQNGEMPLKFKVIRDKGYDGPVTVQMDWKPAGLSTATPVTIPADKSEGTYLLAAARNASAGTHQITLTAMTGSGRVGYNDPTNRTYVASRMFPLTVAEPHVDAKIARTSVERGKTATLVCKLTHLQPFAGKAKVTLARLPRGVELVEPMKEITSEDKEVTFTLRATPEALVGNYQGIVLDLTVIDNGQTVRQLSGSGLIRIDAERGAAPKP